MFRIKDLEFDVRSAFIDAYIDEDDMTVNWGLEVSTFEKHYFDMRWQPRTSSEVFFSSRQGQMKSWLDLANSEFCWEECFDEELEGRLGTLYNFEHEDIFDSKITFQPLSMKSLNLKWEAKTNLFFRESYMEDLDLYIETPVEFKGILFGKSSEEEAKKILEKFFDVDDFVFQQKNSVSLYKPK